MALPGFTAESVLEHTLDTKHRASVAAYAESDASLAAPCCSACEWFCARSPRHPWCRRRWSRCSWGC